MIQSRHYKKFMIALIYMGIAMFVCELYDLSRLISVAETERIFSQLVSFAKYRENTYFFIYFSMLCIATGGSFFIYKRAHWILTHILLITSIFTLIFPFFQRPHFVKLNTPFIPFFLIILLTCSLSGMYKKKYRNIVGIKRGDIAQGILGGLISVLICMCI